VEPGYPLLLAAIYAVFGPSTLAVGVVQAGLGGVTAALIAWLAWRLAGSVAGVAAGLLAAFYPHLVFWTGHVLTETPFVLLVIFTLVLLVEGSVRQKTPWFFAAGLALAAGALTRSVFLIYLPVATILVWWLSTGGARWRSAGALLVGAVVLLAPWTIRNAAEIHVLTPVATKSPFVMWQGNSPASTGGTAGYMDVRDFKPLPLPAGTSEAATYNAYSAAVVDYLKQHPLSVLERAPIKFWNMWRPVYADSSVRNWIVTGGSYVVTLALAAIGLWSMARRSTARPVAYVYGYLGITFVFHLVVTGMIRFRLPLEAVLLVAAGIGVAALAQVARVPRRSARQRVSVLAPMDG
jgi:4-amino-4-deoxy-L-arabinose transferase-like glycosyltransferase